MIGVNFFIENNQLSIINILGFIELSDSFNLFSKKDIIDYISFIRDNQIGKAKDANDLYKEIKERTASIINSLVYTDFNLDKIPIKINKISVKDLEFKINKTLSP